MTATTLGAGGMTVNGLDLAAYGLAVGEWGGALDYATASADVASLAGHAGAILMASEIAQEPRTISVTGYLFQPTTAALSAAVDSLKRRLTGPLELQWRNLPGRYALGRLTSLVTTTTGYQGTATTARVTLTLVCDDPTLYAVDPDLYALSATPVPITLGSAPAIGQITLTGPATNPFVVVRDHAGIVRGVLAFTISMTAYHALVIDLATGQVTRWANGLPFDDAAAYVASGDIPVLDPGDADDLGAAWPTLAVQDAAGTVTGTAVIRRAWM